MKTRTALVAMLLVGFAHRPPSVVAQEAQPRTADGGQPRFEAQATAALAILDAASLPRDLDVHCRVLHFDSAEGGLEHLVLLQARLAEVTFQEDVSLGRFHGHLTVLGQVKNASGHYVESFGQEYPISGPLDRIAETRSAHVTLARRLRLAPGEYALELVVRDAQSGKAYAERSALTVNAPDARLGLSSLVIIDGSEWAEGAAPSDPLRVENAVLIPNMGQAIVRTPGQEVLALYYVVYFQPGAKDAPIARLEVLGNGATRVRGEGPLPPADALGRIPSVSTIPLGSLEPGDYSVRVTVTAGEASVEESATFTVGS